MLAIIFFALIFSSLLWLIYAAVYISDSLAGISLADAGIANTLLYALLVCAPIYLIWTVFGQINQYFHNRGVNAQLHNLLKQAKKNQDYSDLLARALIEAEQHIGDSLAMSRFDVLIADMNELLTEIIRGCKLASAEQIDNLWNKVQNGGKWAFAKVIIEVCNAQPEFQRRVFEYGTYNNMLGGAIMEFCARYDALLQMLEKHDHEKIYLNIIETGVMGKVFSILSPVATEIYRGREASSNFAPTSVKKPLNAFKPTPQPMSEPTPIPEPKSEPRPKPKPQPTLSTEDDEPRESLLEKLRIFRKKERPAEPEQTERDPFSIALERSFGDDSAEAPAPQFEPRISMPSVEPESMPIAEQTEEPKAEPTVVDIPMTDTQRTLENLKKEWAKAQDSVLDETAPQPENDTPPQSLVYPFGNWLNEDNYKK